MRWLMPFHSKTTLISLVMLLIFAIVPTANAVDDLDESLGCETDLSGGAAPQIEFALYGEIPGSGIESAEWSSDADGAVWLHLLKPADGNIEDVQPSLSLVPSRVRIMPLGEVDELVAHRTRSGELFHAVGSKTKIKLLAGTVEKRLLNTIPFEGWSGLVPRWSLDENSDSVLIAISSDHKLNAFYPFSPDLTPVSMDLGEGELINPDVARAKDGRVLTLVHRAKGRSEIFALRDGAFHPEVVMHSQSSHLFTGLGDRPWLSWIDHTSEGVTQVKAAVLEGLTTPAFTFTLEAGETVSHLSYQRLSELSGQFAVVTTRRVLIFNAQSR